MIKHALALVAFCLLTACSDGVLPFAHATEPDAAEEDTLDALAPDGEGTGYVLDDELDLPDPEDNDDKVDSSEEPLVIDPPVDDVEQVEQVEQVEDVSTPAPLDRNAAARAACVKKGGAFTGTKSGAFVCVTRTRDSNKTCTASSQCQGSCLSRSRTCAPVLPLVGCHEVLTNSGRVSTVCID